MYTQRYITLEASLIAWAVKNLSAMQETWVQSLGMEDSLEKKMATHSSILAWEIPQTEERVGYSPWGHKRIEHDGETDIEHCITLIMLWVSFVHLEE